MYVCGSSCEGSYTPGNEEPDTDIISCDETVPIIEDISKANDQYHYSLMAITEEDTPDGYIKLQLVVEGTRTTVKDWPYLQQFVREQNITIVLDRNRQLVLLDWPKLHLPSIFLRSKNKPVVTIVNGKTDMVRCYRCKTWPTIANEWLTRRRCY
ncbi:unnamed protein product [Mytilus coruscus]|uniref:Uncharacterized protein n=1 Tax=Mytilus coruscus TaxID=42192 RepID=A0A6J8ADZ2_MYTCO|nr:unnamed protein product [Mytilus coruscus]